MIEVFSSLIKNQVGFLQRLVSRIASQAPLFVLATANLKAEELNMNLMIPLISQ